MRTRSGASVLSNPVLVGAVTTLVVLVAVFLAYNANKGLPFVPTVQVEAVVPDAYKLVEGNEVREGGFRVGVVDAIEAEPLPDRSAGARLKLKLDKKAAPIPADSTIRIRPRSALGLKYVELQRGDAADTLVDGATISVDESALTIELEDFFNIFDEDTRRNVQLSLEGYGNALAGRGRSLNQAFEALPVLFGDLPPVMRVLSDPRNRLGRLFKELGDAARIARPDIELIADGFVAGADTFEALSRDPDALKATIEKSPDTLRVGERSLRAQRPFLRNLALIAGDFRGSAAELRRSAPVLTGALRAGIDPLRRTPPLNRRLGTTFQAVTSLAQAPGTNRGITGLVALMTTLNPQLRYLGPHITVCNNWNMWWTYLADHLSDEDGTGTLQRIQAKEVPPNSEQTDLDSFGAPRATKGAHAQAYGAAIDDQGNADCENGQRGYMEHLAAGVPKERQIVLDPETPGIQGTTFTGRPRVPEGQTFQRLPPGPAVRP
jgi:virulence factor Mce-like protein